MEHSRELLTQRIDYLENAILRAKIETDRRLDLLNGAGERIQGIERKLAANQGRDQVLTVLLSGFISTAVSILVFFLTKMVH